MEGFRRMIDPDMLVEDSDGNCIGTVGELKGNWFVLESRDGQRQQVQYDSIANVLGNTVVLNITRGELFGNAA